MKSRAAVKPRIRGGALLLALLLGVVGMLQGTSIARADAIQPIAVNSLTLTKIEGYEYPANTTVYLWDRVELSGNWSVPDYSSHGGDHFTVAIPQGLEGTIGSFGLDGADGTSYGSCVVESALMTCTLNDNVNNKANVGGTFKLNMLANKLTTASKMNFTINGSIVAEVPLPNNAPGIGYSPWLPTEIQKYAFFTGNTDGLTWRVRLPGKVLPGTTLSIDDPYGIAGVTYTYVPDSARLLAINYTPECFHQDNTPGCSRELAANINVDEANNRITLDYDNGGAFSHDILYLFEFSVSIKEEVLVGAEFPNTVSVNGTGYYGVASRTASGSGTGSGENTVGHIELTKKVEGTGTVPAGTTFPVTYEYLFNGETRNGTLDVPADGSIRLNNVPHGTTVTLTEQVPGVTGVSFGDPSFSGDGVADGGAGSASAVVTIAGTQTRAVTLTNPTTPSVSKVVPQDPTVAAGVCPADSTTPTEPTVTYAQTHGIDYTHTVTPGDSANQVIIKVVATAQAGNEIDTDNLPAGWSVVDGKVTYQVTKDVPRCVVPVLPVIEVGTCEVGSLTPTAPSVTFADVAGLKVVSSHSVEGGKVKVTATATPEAGFAIGGPLPDGWTLQADGSAVFAGEKDQPVCEATKVVPVNPVVTASVCEVGSTTPTTPVITPATTAGLVYEITSAKEVDGKFVYTVTATPTNEAYVINPDDLPEGWSAPVNGVSTFTGSVDLPKCAQLVAPKIDAGACVVGSLTPTEPSVAIDEVEGIEVTSSVTVEDGKVKVTATAKPKDGYQIGGTLPEGWVLNSDGTATYSGQVDQIVCQPTEVTPVTPKIVAGVCKPGSSKPTEPTVELPKVPGLSYGIPSIKVEGKKVTITVTATPETAYVIGKSDLPEGWTLNEDGSATFTYTGKVPTCGKPGLPKTGD